MDLSGCHGVTFRRRLFPPGLSCDPDGPREGEDIVADEPSSARFHDDRCLLPVKVGQVKGGDGDEAVKDYGVASDAKAEVACHNSPIIGGHDLINGSFHVDAEVEPRLSRVNIPDLTDDDDADDDVVVLAEKAHPCSARAMSKTHNFFRLLKCFLLSIVVLVVAMALMVTVLSAVEQPTSEPVIPIKYFQFTWQFYTLVMITTITLMTIASVMTASRWSHSLTNTGFMEIHKNHGDDDDDNDDDDDDDYHDCADFVIGGVPAVQDVCSPAVQVQNCPRFQHHNSTPTPTHH